MTMPGFSDSNAVSKAVTSNVGTVVVIIGHTLCFVTADMLGFGTIFNVSGAGGCDDAEGNAHSRRSTRS